MPKSNIYKHQSKKNDRRNVEVDNIHKYNEYTYKKYITRDEFSRDKDRILFSKAFRRLEHKAQIYSHERGDHFRTRLTHTLEVLQIAKSIARNLGLNEDLTEAITLGHDIGHTPFGHQGERILDQVMSGENDLGIKQFYKVNYGGFKHNFNSLKVLDRIEVKYDDIDGLNLTWQVLEGILKHTGIKRSLRTWDLQRNILQDSNNNEFNHRLMDSMKYTSSITLEGQIVAIADEVTQRQHDLDDGMRDDKLNLRFEDVYKEIIKYIKNIRSNIENNESNTVYINQLLNLEDRLEARAKSGNIRYKKSALVRDIIEYFICDITLASNYNIERVKPEDIEEEDDRITFKKKLIDFSNIGYKLNEKLEKYIKYKILNSYEVNRFDGKSSFIIRQLFKAYYSNPRQMERDALHKLNLMISKNSKIYEIKLHECGLKIKDISFQESPPNEVDALINYLKLNIDLLKLNIPDNPNRPYTFYAYTEYTKQGNRGSYLSNKIINEINEYNLEKIEEDSNRKEELLFIKCMLEDHNAFLSVICDYISGMTDNFAKYEYNQLYQV